MAPREGPEAKGPHLLLRRRGPGHPLAKGAAPFDTAASPPPERECPLPSLAQEAANPKPLYGRARWLVPAAQRAPKALN